MNHPKSLKLLSFSLSIVIFITNVALVHSYETNVWEERQKNVPSSSSLVPSDRTFKVASLLNSQIPLNNGNQPIPTQFYSSQITRNEELGTRNVVNLPHQFGSIRKITPGKSDRTIIHIQDIHLNSEAQTNISNTIQFLMKEKKMDLLALEGAFGKIDIKRFQEFPYPNTKKAVGDYLLKEGKISGAIYSALTMSREIPALVGVDDKAHYDKNIQAYRDSLILKEEISEKLRQKKQKIEKKKRRGFNKRLLNFDLKVGDFREEKLSLGGYLEYLNQEAKKNRVSDQYQNIEKFLKALQIEQALNFELIDHQRGFVLEKIIQKTTVKESEYLVQLGAAYRLGKITHDNFYSHLQRLCRRYHITLKHTPDLNSYIHYVLLTESIDAEALYKEKRDLEQIIYEKLISTPEERSLVNQSRRFDLEIKLIEFSLTSDEWREYRKTVLSTKNAFKGFYEEAEARDQFMARNLTKAMDEHEAKIAVLVTGGFHANGIRNQLGGNDTIITFVPKLTKIKPNNASEYLTVFSQEKTPLDKLFAGDKLFVSPKVMADSNFMAFLFAAHRHWLGGSFKGTFSRLSSKTISMPVEIIKRTRQLQIKFKEVVTEIFFTDDQIEKVNSSVRLSAALWSGYWFWDIVSKAFDYYQQVDPYSLSALLIGIALIIWSYRGRWQWPIKIEWSEQWVASGEALMMNPSGLKFEVKFQPPIREVHMSGSIDQSQDRISIDRAIELIENEEGSPLKQIYSHLNFLVEQVGVNLALQEPRIKYVENSQESDVAEFQFSGPFAGHIVVNPSKTNSEKILIQEFWKAAYIWWNEIVSENEVRFIDEVGRDPEAEIFWKIDMNLGRRHKSGDLEGTTVLEFSSRQGAGLSALLSEKYGISKVVGVDNSEEFVERSRTLLKENYDSSRFDVVQGNGVDLPFGEGTFDHVFMRNKWGHIIPHTRPWVLNELNRVLKPGGTITFPIRHNETPDTNWRELLKETGFVNFSSAENNEGTHFIYAEKKGGPKKTERKKKYFTREYNKYTRMTYRKFRQNFSNHYRNDETEKIPRDVEGEIRKLKPVLDKLSGFVENPSSHHGGREGDAYFIMQGCTDCSRDLIAPLLEEHGLSYRSVFITADKVWPYRSGHNFIVVTIAGRDYVLDLTAHQFDVRENPDYRFLSDLTTYEMVNEYSQNHRATGVVMIPLDELEEINRSNRHFPFYDFTGAWRMEAEPHKIEWDYREDQLYPITHLTTLVNPKIHQGDQRTDIIREFEPPIHWMRGGLFTNGVSDLLEMQINPLFIPSGPTISIGIQPHETGFPDFLLFFHTYPERNHDLSGEDMWVSHPYLNSIKKIRSISLNYVGGRDHPSQVYALAYELTTGEKGVVPFDGEGNLINPNFGKYAERGSSSDDQFNHTAQEFGERFHDNYGRLWSQAVRLRENGFEEIPVPNDDDFIIVEVTDPEDKNEPGVIERFIPVQFKMYQPFWDELGNNMQRKIIRAATWQDPPRPDKIIGRALTIPFDSPRMVGGKWLEGVEVKGIVWLEEGNPRQPNNKEYFGRGRPLVQMKPDLMGRMVFMPSSGGPTGSVLFRTTIREFFMMWKMRFLGLPVDTPIGTGKYLDPALTYEDSAGDIHQTGLFVRGVEKIERDRGDQRTYKWLTTLEDVISMIDEEFSKMSPMMQNEDDLQEALHIQKLNIGTPVASAIADVMFRYGLTLRLIHDSGFIWSSPVLNNISIDEVLDGIAIKDLGHTMEKRGMRKDHAIQYQAFELGSVISSISSRIDHRLEDAFIKLIGTNIETLIGSSFTDQFLRGYFHDRAETNISITAEDLVYITMSREPFYYGNQIASPSQYNELLHDIVGQLEQPFIPSPGQDGWINPLPQAYPMDIRNFLNYVHSRLKLAGDKPSAVLLANPGDQELTETLVGEQLLTIEGDLGFTPRLYKTSTGNYILHPNHPHVRIFELLVQNRRHRYEEVMGEPMIPEERMAGVNSGNLGEISPGLWAGFWEGLISVLNKIKLRDAARFVDRWKYELGAVLEGLLFVLLIHLKFPYSETFLIWFSFSTVMHLVFGIYLSDFQREFGVDGMWADREIKRSVVKSYLWSIGISLSSGVALIPHYFGGSLISIILFSILPHLIINGLIKSIPDLFKNTRPSLGLIAQLYRIFPSRDFRSLGALYSQDERDEDWEEFVTEYAYNRLLVNVSGRSKVQEKIALIRARLKNQIIAPLEPKYVSFLIAGFESFLTVLVALLVGNQIQTLLIVSGIIVSLAIYSLYNGFAGQLSTRTLVWQLLRMSAGPIYLLGGILISGMAEGGTFFNQSFIITEPKMWVMFFMVTLIAFVNKRNTYHYSYHPLITKNEKEWLYSMVKNSNYYMYWEEISKLIRDIAVDERYWRTMDVDKYLTRETYDYYMGHIIGKLWYAKESAEVLINLLQINGGVDLLDPQDVRELLELNRHIDSDESPEVLNLTSTILESEQVDRLLDPTDVETLLESISDPLAVPDSYYEFLKILLANPHAKKIWRTREFDSVLHEIYRIPSDQNEYQATFLGRDRLLGLNFDQLSNPIRLHMFGRLLEINQKWAFFYFLSVITEGQYENIDQLPSKARLFIREQLDADEHDVSWIMSNPPSQEDAISIMNTASKVLSDMSPVLKIESNQFNVAVMDNLILSLGADPDELLERDYAIDIKPPTPENIRRYIGEFYIEPEEEFDSIEQMRKQSLVGTNGIVHRFNGTLFDLGSEFVMSSDRYDGSYRMKNITRGNIEPARGDDGFTYSTKAGERTRGMSAEQVHQYIRLGAPIEETAVYIWGIIGLPMVGLAAAIKIIFYSNEMLKGVLHNVILMNFTLEQIFLGSLIFITILVVLFSATVFAKDHDYVFRMSSDGLIKRHKIRLPEDRPTYNRLFMRGLGDGILYAAPFYYFLYLLLKNQVTVQDPEIILLFLIYLLPLGSHLLRNNLPFLIPQAFWKDEFTAIASKVPDKNTIGEDLNELIPLVRFDLNNKTTDQKSGDPRDQIKEDVLESYNRLRDEVSRRRKRIDKLGIRIRKIRHQA